MVEGERPFIGATEFNNGITTFVSNTNKSFDSNVLGVNYNVSVVKSFYHEYECIFSDDVKRQKIMLPVLEDGNIDFEYMIDQMKWLEFKEIFKLLSSIR